MKSVILLSLFLSFFFLSGQAQESQLNNFSLEKTGDIPDLLFSHDYNRKAEILNHLHSSEFINELKSSEGNYLLDSIVAQEWSDDLNSFENTNKYVYLFENEGRNVLLKIYDWNGELAKWSLTFDMYYYFNNEDKLIRAEFELYVTAIYKMFTKIEYSYSNGLLTQEAFYTKYEEEEPWAEDGQTAYFYNSDNLLFQGITIVWDEFQQIWIDGDKTEYIYNSIGNLIKESEYSWDDYSMEWTENSRIENSFDSKNNLIESIKYRTGILSGTLALDTKMEYRYDSSSLIIREILYEWEYDLLIWLAKEKSEYAETETDTLFQITNFTWIENQHSWKKDTKSEFFATQLLAEQEILYREYVDVYLPFYVFDNTVCDLIESSAWNGTEWNKTDFTTYYFSPTTDISVEKLPNVKALVYPNPTANYLVVEFNNTQETICLIRDLNGRTISQSTIANKERLNLSSYQPGIYFVELQQKGKKIFIEKIIKK